MVARLLLLWVVVESLSLYAVVRWAGVLGALLLLIMGSTSGYLLLRGEGLSLASRLAGFLRHAQSTGEFPTLPIAEALPRFLAGVLLLVPGFATDVLAALVLLPPLRGVVVRRVHRIIVERHHAVLRERGMVDTTGIVLPEGIGEEDDERPFGGGDEEDDDMGPDVKVPPKLGGGPRFKVP